jgi:signal transduction histidine kinase
VKRSGLTRAAPALLLATLLLLTGVATYATAVRVHDRERDQLADDAGATVALLDRRMEDYAQILRGAAGLYNASEDVSVKEFHDFFADQQVVQRFPGVRVIGFASYVPRAGLDGYVRDTRRALKTSGLRYGSFAVHPTPAPQAQEALVIDQVEPPPGDTKALGLDLLSETNRRRAALLARRTGSPAATAPISLVQAGGPSLGIDLMVPVYGGPPSQTGAPRTWSGVVFAAFRMDNLLRGILGPAADQADLEVYDLGPSATVPADTPLSNRAVAFDPRAARAGRSRDGVTLVQTLDVAGRRWAMAYTGSRSSLSEGERAVPWVIAVAGILVSLLAAALLRTLSTSRIRAERLVDERTAELREREEQLRESNAELEHFAYLASHDLQEPLRTITSYVGLLENRLGDQLDDRARSWLGFVSDGAGRMSRLIADLLEYSRTGRAHADDDAQTADLEQAWDLAVANLQHAIADAGATIERGPLPTVQAQPREMTSMLQNLIGNGLKYRGEAPPVVRASASREDGRWEIAIADNGIGIEPRFHDRVFGLFQRLHTSEEYPGTGMGLAIVKKIVESNGGSVRVESDAGQGATFVVTLREAGQA